MKSQRHQIKNVQVTLLTVLFQILIKRFFVAQWTIACQMIMNIIRIDCFSINTFFNKRILKIKKCLFLQLCPQEIGRIWRTTFYPPESWFEQGLYKTVIISFANKIDKFFRSTLSVITYNHSICQIHLLQKIFISGDSLARFHL